jgi:GNAT superfamily N-acetyltransferase
MCSLAITDDWLRAPKGIIPYPLHGSHIGSHSVMMCGYDQYHGQFEFANSWGQRWGNNGYGKISFECFEATMTEAWTVRLGSFPTIPSPRDGINTLTWGTLDFHERSINLFEYYDVYADDRIAWAIAVIRDYYFEVDDLFVKPAYRAKGIGAALCTEITKRANKLKLPVRFWISPADTLEPNLTVIDHLCKRIKLVRKPSGVRWTQFKAEATPLTKQEQEFMDNSQAPGDYGRPRPATAPSHQLAAENTHMTIVVICGLIAVLCIVVAVHGVG